MPIVHIYAFDRTIEAKRKAVKDVTRVLAEAYEIPQSHIIVKIRKLEKDRCAHGGVLVSDRDAPKN